MTRIRPPAFDRVRRTLAATRRRLWARAGLTATGWAAAALGALTLGVVLVGAAGAGPWLRPLWLTLGALGLMAVAALTVVRPGWRWRHDDAVAEHLEQGLPALADGLRATVQFGRQWPEVPGSPALVARLAEGVADTLADSDLAAVTSLRPARRPWALAAGVAAAWGLLGLLAPGTLSAGFKALQPPVNAAGEVETGPLVGDLELTLTYPAYVHRAPKTIPNSAGDFEAPKGTRVTLKATTLEPVEAVHLRFGEDAEGPALAVTGGRSVSGAFVVTAGGRWRFAVTTPGGDSQVESAPRRIRLEPDTAPEVLLKVPAEDLELDDLRDVPVVFEARDDFGLTKVNVVIALAADPEHPEKVAQPAVEGRRYAGDEVVDLSVVQAQPGDRIALFVEAFDANDVDGPQRGVSATRYITVNDPKQKHFELSERLREVIELLVTALADRLEVEFYATGPDVDPLPARIGKYTQSTEKASLALAAVVADMVGDPLTPEEVRLALAGKLGSLEERVRAEARLVEASTAALEAGAKATVDRANKANERVVDALEQAIVLVEAMVARLALEDMEALAEELQAMRSRLKDLIQQYKKNPDDKALKARIMREIQRLRQRMDAMRQRMAQLRQKLPEEFLNLDGLKKDDVAKGLDKTKDQLAELEKMLEEGKLDEALAALEEMEAALDELSNTLDKDMQELHENSDPAMQKAISELMDQAKDLQREQEAVSDETEQLKQQADAEMKRLFEEELKEKLQAVNEKAAQLKKQADNVDASNLPRPAQDDLKFAQEQADGLKKALERQQLMEALEAAENARQHLRNTDQMSRYDPRARSEQGKLREGEQLAEQVGDELRDMLRQAMQQAAQGGDPQQSRKLGQRQMQLAERAEKLRQRVGEQAQQMPQLGQEAQQRIQQAGQAMQQAGDQLGQGRPGQARPGQQQAMSELDGMMQALKNANKPQRAQRGQDGKPQGQGRRSSREKVKIPGAEDHTSPEAFRKELLEVMKDGAPKAYEQQVKRYYESLVE